jgi:hypothetical protein
MTARFAFVVKIIAKGGIENPKNHQSLVSKYLSKNIITQIKQLNINISGLNSSRIPIAGGNRFISESIINTLFDLKPFSFKKVNIPNNPIK